MSMDLALRGTIEEINQKLISQQDGFLQRQIEWRQALIERYQAEIDELLLKQSEQDEEDAKNAATFIETTKVTAVTPKTVARVRNNRKRSKAVGE